MNPRANYRVVVIEGDGIGPSIVGVTVSALRAVEARLGTFKLDLEMHEGGAAHYERTGENLSAATLASIRMADATLKGPVGLPGVRGPDGTEAGLLGGVLRTGLDTFANVRPVTVLPGVRSPLGLKAGEIDYVLVRENTEGLYLSRGKAVGTGNAATDSMLITRQGTERVVRYAFEIAARRSGAPADGKKRVTCVDKANVLGSHAFFQRIFYEMAEEFPEVEADHLYADAAAQALVLNPQRFDVLVMENFLGDILSDLGGATIGGIGLCPSGNIGMDHAYFEPVHGSAPDIADQDRANPIAQVLSAAMLLEHLGLREGSRLLRVAVSHALAIGSLEVDSRGQPVGGTRLAGKAIVEALSQV